MSLADQPLNNGERKVVQVGNDNRRRLGTSERKQTNNGMGENKGKYSKLSSWVSEIIFDSWRKNYNIFWCSIYVEEMLETIIFYFF